MAETQVAGSRGYETRQSPVRLNELLDGGIKNSVKNVFATSYRKSFRPLDETWTNFLTGLLDGG